jgi:integrase
MRTRYQFGSIYLEERKRGPSVWVFRYSENGVRKKVRIGTARQYRTRAEATKAAEGLRLVANPDRPAGQAVTLRALAHQYLREELPARKSTGRSYRLWINGYIEPQWGDYTLAELVRAPFAVEQWLNNLALAPKSKAHIRSVMRIMLNCAMRWGLVQVQQNPLSLVRVKGCTKRRKQPVVISAEQCIAIAGGIPEPFKTMVFVAMCLGLRVSEILGLRWGDFDWENLAVNIRRAFVLGTEDQVKTLYSEKLVPLDPALAELLFGYKRVYAPDGTADDWVFSNPDTGRPWWPHQIQQKRIRTAGLKVLGIDGIGWHTFRHSYSSLLRHLGVDVKVQQELLRHADIRTTMNTYTQAMREDLREANSRVVRLVLRETYLTDPI